MRSPLSSLHEIAGPSEKEEREPARIPSLPRELPPGPFRSLGRRLDYSGWPDCQRFLELDQEIMREAEENGNHEAPDDIRLVA